MSRTRDICTFHLGPYLFGLDVALVQEVLVQQLVTRVPLAPDSVAGVMNLRGQIVMTVDLRRRLDLEPRAASDRPVSIVVRTEAEPVAFLVDRAGDVLSVDEDQFERPPETLRGAPRELITGAYKQSDHLLLVLDAERAANPEPAAGGLSADAE
jgi:purine-binding chemotaxis protein CheW